MEDKTMEVFKRGSKLLNILQDEKRQQILVLLCREEQLTVNQITERLTISRPAVSHHLKLMYEVGLLGVEQVGLERYYRSDLDDALLWLKELTASLEENIKNKEKA
ncbi:ArsR/SmtB family transcription factor [Mammaliicoccus sciuri]|uniref:ArsR/SmtB family transcription factor n=1 Tax=Mammaliicoccus sciuri TaxID=1296 RepID=UPI001E4A497E|nr:metalloregulator ArsR/SmtB family transcription factor [Mammaliicoccus sciuri]MCD3218831.1 metalloregulator ArsR/SmtB family transcription factor [Mammaliicoccus sciuri]MCD8809171.1 metalloregulator ArsR/SmtB family transcription factor [Mammaliicoccus sciuri]MCJ0909640.1 metalloregulator ArsR/SmtB family transcription factor [Mammaliicoccus sciuri]UXU69185.1 metalloregulator ArsR/SmtB family transcription factor [Mammaliicoccus sciuri]